MIKRVFTRDFISGKVKYFHFGVWSISYNCLHDKNRNETHCGCYFIVVILTEMKFNLGWKNLCKHYPKWNHMKGNICTGVNKNDWLLLNGPFISGYHRYEIRFISTAMKSDVNRIYFMVDWNLFRVDFISDLI